MDKLATIPTNATQQQQAVFELLPAWLNYLVAAYPTAGIAKMTLAVMEDQLSDIDQQTIMAAAKAHVKASKWFPTAAELRRLVEHIQLETAIERQAAMQAATFEQRQQGDMWRVRPGGVWERLPMATSDAAATWPACPTCEERTPDLDNCPFCADLAAIPSEPDHEPAGNVAPA